MGHQESIDSGVPVNKRPRFTYGKYEGRRIWDIIIIDPNYVKAEHRANRLTNLNKFLEQCLK